MITDRIDLLDWLRNQLDDADADLLPEMVRTFAETLMGAEPNDEGTIARRCMVLGCLAQARLIEPDNPDLGEVEALEAAGRNQDHEADAA